MIEIKFSGTYPSEVHNSIESFMELKKPISSDPVPPIVTYKPIQSASDDKDHTVTLVHDLAVACTCQWFRFHPLEKWCRHMKAARLEAISERT
jgi:hypothetical protein